MKEVIKRFTIISAAVVVMAMPAVASAHDHMAEDEAEDDTTTSISEEHSSGHEQENEQEKEYKDRLSARLRNLREARREKMKDDRSDLHERLEGVKRKACENHASTIDRLMTKINKRHQNAFDHITRVATAVETFYTSKNLSVSNYDSLVAEANAAKSVAETAMQSQLAIPTLDCNGKHPRADVASFKEKRQDSVDAMKAYRDAVKKLIKAVRTAAEATQSATEEGTSNAE